MNLTPEYAVDDLEQQLKLSLRRVDPNPKFVDHLHDRLTTPSQFIIEHRHSIGIELALVAISLFAGILLIWLLRELFPNE